MLKKLQKLCFVHFCIWRLDWIVLYFHDSKNTKIFKKFNCSGNEKWWVDTSHIFYEKIEKIPENLAFCELAWTIKFCKSLENSTIVKSFSDWFFEMVIIWLKLKIQSFFISKFHLFIASLDSFFLRLGMIKLHFWILRDFWRFFKILLEVWLVTEWVGDALRFFAISFCSSDGSEWNCFVWFFWGQSKIVGDSWSFWLNWWPKRMTCGKLSFSAILWRSNRSEMFVIGKILMIQWNDFNLVVLKAANWTSLVAFNWACNDLWRHRAYVVTLWAY